MPLISYAATDPTLSTLQYAYFFHSTQSDSFQMATIADLVDFYGWKEVIAVYVDDDYGRNGISALDDAIAKKISQISYKLPLPSNFDLSDITSVLNKSKSLGPRVYIVHVNPDPELKIFNVAKQLHMFTSDYVWFAKDWLCTSLDSFSLEERSSFPVLEGVVALCQHTPQTAWKEEKITAKWFSNF